MDTEKLVCVAEVLKSCNPVIEKIITKDNNVQLVVKEGNIRGVVNLNIKEQFYEILNSVENIEIHKTRGQWYVTIENVKAVGKELDDTLVEAIWQCHGLKYT